MNVWYATLAILYAMGMAYLFVTQRERVPRMRSWLTIATANFDPSSAPEDDGTRWTGVVDGVGWTVVTPRPQRKREPEPRLAVALDARIGFRATVRSLLSGAAGVPTGDAAFDAQILLHDDAGCAAAVLNHVARERVLDWLHAGGKIDAGCLELPIPWETLPPEEFPVWVRALATQARTLSVPDDRHAALVARLLDPDRPTRLFAAATLRDKLPEAGRDALLDDVWAALEAPEPPRHVVEVLMRLATRGDAATRRLVPLLASPHAGVAVEVAWALGSLGTADAIMPLLEARPGPVGDARLRAAVDDALQAIRGTLQGIDGGRLSVVEGDVTRGGLSVVEDVAGQVALAEAPVADEAPVGLAAQYAAAKAGDSTRA